MVSIFIALPLAVAAFFAILSLLRASAGKQIAVSMKQEADRAVVNALRNFAVRLDFSPGSVQTVEKILSQYHGNPKLPGTANDLALQLGAYVGEVIRREKGAVWSVPPGKDLMDIEVTWGGRSVRPMQWCVKRMMNGKDDNLWIKFQFMMEQRSPVAAGTKAPTGAKVATARK